jgi:outer membrane protein assembly factor BamB
MNHKRLVATLVITTCLTMLCAQAAEPAWIGYRGPEGSGVFANSNPPTDCDLKSGRNVLWRAPLPNWAHGQPTIVKDRAFVLSEAGWKSDWPVLTCIDIQTGKVLWEREINHLPATGLSPEKQQEVAKKWGDFHAEWRRLYTIFAETIGQDQKNQEPAKERFKEAGYNLKGYSGGGYGQLRKLDPKPTFENREAGLRHDVWRHACGLASDEIGCAFATPVTDGKDIFVLVNRTVAASYDLDGKLRWMSFVGFQPERNSHFECTGGSAVLYEDLVITTYFGHAYAFDKATGKVRWTVKTFTSGISTPVIATIPSSPGGSNAAGSGTTVLIAEGWQGKGGGVKAIRLPDGKPLALTGWGPGGNAITLNTDQRDVVYFGSGVHAEFKTADSGIPQAWTNLPAAVRFTIEGETLKPTVLWSGGADGFPLYHQGRVYLGSTVCDAMTGEVLAGGRGKPRVVPAARHHLLIAGDRLYGLDGHSGLADGPPPAGKPEAILSCYKLDGTKIADSPLFLAEPTAEKKAQLRSQVGWDRWNFGYGLPFNIAGDRLYIRSSDELICIGGK